MVVKLWLMSIIFHTMVLEQLKKQMTYWNSSVSELYHRDTVIPRRQYPPLPLPFMCLPINNMDYPKMIPKCWLLAAKVKISLKWFYTSKNTLKI